MKIKTVLLVRNAASWQFGGAEQLTLNFAREFKKVGISPIVVTRVPELIQYAKREEITTFKNIWFRNVARRRFAILYFLFAPVLVAQYYYLVKRYRINVMLLGSRDDQIFGTMAAKLAHIPAIWIDHADMKHIVRLKSRLSRPYYWAQEQAKKIIVVSQAEKKLIEPYLENEVKQKVVIITNGAVKSSSTPLSKAKGTRIVSFVGRIEQDKGVYELIEAAQQVFKKTDNVEFWLAGKGRAVPKINEIIKEKNLKHIKLLGHLDNVGSLLQISNLFVYPSHHDASPLAPVEAMLYGVPVISTQVGGIPEIVPPKAGVLLPVGDADLLAKTILKLLGDNESLMSYAKGAAEQGRVLELSSLIKNKYIPLLEESLNENHV